MSTVSIESRDSLDADRPVRITLHSDHALGSSTVHGVTDAASLFIRFAREGAFQEVKQDTAATVSLLPNGATVDLHDLPADAATLGVLGRLLLALPTEWSAISAQGSPARLPDRALAPLESSLSMVPRLRSLLRAQCEIDTGVGWHCLEVTRRSGWSARDLTVLQSCADLWLAVCRAGGLSTVTSSLAVTRGDVGMDPPQVGEDFWSAQIGANDIQPGAISALVNMLDHSVGTRVALDTISVT